MRRVLLVLTLVLGLLTTVLAGSSAASVSRSEDFLSLASRTYPVTVSSVAHKDIAAGTGKGYWLAASDGGVFALGDALFAGSAAGITSHAIVGMAKTKTGKGYWLAASDGGVFAFGDAKFYGSVPSLNPPAKGEHVFSGIAAAADGNGYYLYDRHAHIYSFGSAVWHGSPAGFTQDRPITALTVRPSGNGYYVMDIRGSHWGYGDVGAGGPSSQPGYADQPFTRNGFVQMAAPSGDNIYALQLNGTVVAGHSNDSSAPSYGSSTSDYRMTALAPTSAGYYEAAMDGSVFAHGNAVFYGSLPQYVSAKDLAAPIIAMATSGPTS